MLYLEPNSNDPAFNIAFEEFAFRKIADRDDVFILWINKPCIVVGKNQNTVEEINQKYCDQNNIKIVRRISGGGAVYHDLNNLNYTIISSEDSSAGFDFNSFSMPVIETLAEIGIKATFSGRNDIIIGDSKFCGNAQYIKKNRVMHHGCILFDVDLTVLSRALKVSKDKIESKGKKSVRSRVTNIKEHLKDTSLTVEDFKNLLKSYMNKHYHMTDYHLTDLELEEVQKIKASRNDSWDWVYGENPEFTIKRSRRFESGKVEAQILVIKGIIENIKFYGDFFGVRDVDELAKKLKNVKYEAKSVKSILEKQDISSYFMGLSTDDVVDVIVD
ncbi:MAG: lipoate--protein ligase [Clostridiales bacterium]|nr:MAG: lipoate--protein ligase [Clostridiales bacterium]